MMYSHFVGAFGVLALGAALTASEAHAFLACEHKACSDEVAASGLSSKARAGCFNTVRADCHAGLCSCTGGSLPCSCTCGDGLCGPSEDCATCPQDCGQCPCGTFLTKWGSPGSGDGQFDHPFGVATDASENVYVADTSNQRIQKFDASGTFLTKWGSVGTGDGQFQFPEGVATDASGNVYVADDNERIQKFACP